MKVSEERLAHIVGAAGLEPCDWDEVWEGLMVGEVVSMAKELLALRKAFSEPRGYEWVNGDGEVVNILKHNPKSGDWSEQYWGDRKFSAIPLYRKPE